MQFAYSKRRSDFGRACYFAERPTEVLVEINPDQEIKDQFIRINPYTRMIQAVGSLSEHWVNTERAEMKDDGINHEEGGWQKDINPYDIDQTTRYRKKAEREDSYLSQMANLNKRMEHFVLQNNAINIYERYFEDSKVLDYDPHSSAKVVAVFRDPEELSRPVSHISWHPEGPQKVALAHCVLDFQGQLSNMSSNSYIWRMDDIFTPDLVLRPPFPAVCLEYSPRDANLLAGGLCNGQVVFWDIRRSGYPVEKSALEHSHQDPVHHIAWISSKTGTDCFSTATDGKVIWWDLRNMQEPLEEMFIDLSRKNDVVRIQGGTCLEYDATMPSKFLVGTESGNVISCSRKGKLPGERIVGVFPAHIGPVCALKRNPFFPKCFLTVGDWSAKIWSEDGRESPIIWTPYYKEYLTSGCWSATRPSVFFVTKENGTMDVWDLMHKMKSPVYTIGISSEPIYCVSAQEKGEFVAVGTKAGWLTVMRLGSGLVNQQRNEKASFASTIEHGIKREKILETKEREKKLQKKLMENLQDKGKDDEILEITEAVMEAERRFFDTVQEEIKKLKEFSMKLNQSQKRLKFIDKKGKEPAKMDAGGDMVRPVRPQSKRTAEGQRRALQAVASVETEHSDETVSDGHPFNLEKNPSTTAEENNAAASAAATAAAPLPPSPPPAAAAVTAVAAVAEVLPNAVEASTFEDESAMSVGGVSTEDSVAHSKNVDPGATVDSDKPRSEETVNLNDYPEMESHQMTNQVTVESGSTLDHLQQASIEPLLEEVAPEDEKRDSEIHEAPNSDHVESESVKHDSET